MRYLCVVLVTCLLLGGVADGRAQASPGDDAALREIYEQFFEALRVGGANGVIGYLRQSGSIAPALLPVLEREARALRVGPSATRPDAHVLVEETRLPRTNRIRTLKFLSYHDNQPVAWRLDFYRRTTGVWIVTNVRWETEYVNDFIRLSALQFAAYRKLLELEIPEED